MAVMSNEKRQPTQVKHNEDEYKIELQKKTLNSQTMHRQIYDIYIKATNDERQATLPTSDTNKTFSLRDQMAACRK